MSRQTPSAVRKRMADALYISYCIGRALRGEDDDISRLIRPHLHNIADVDLNNPDHVELVEALFFFLREELSRAKLTSGAPKRQEAANEAANAVRDDARAYQKERKREGHSAAQSWRLTAQHFKEKYHDLEGKTAEQLRRLWSR